MGSLESLRAEVKRLREQVSQVRERQKLIMEARQEKERIRKTKRSLKQEKKRLSRELHPTRAKFSDLVGKHLRAGDTFKTAAKKAKEEYRKVKREVEAGL